MDLECRSWRAGVMASSTCLSFWRNAPCLLTDLPANVVFIGLPSITIARGSDGIPAWARKDTAPAWLPKQLSRSHVACSRSVEQRDGNVDG